MTEIGKRVSLWNHVSLLHVLHPSLFLAKEILSEMGCQLMPMLEELFQFLRYLPIESKILFSVRRGLH